MIALRTTRTRCTAPLAAVVLVIQALVGGVVPLAHAGERFTAPAHVEAYHGTGCLALHDELRCALCHFAGTQVLPQSAREQPAARMAPERGLAWTVCPHTHGSDHLTAPPRAPPVPLL